MDEKKQIEEMAIENLVAFLWHNTNMYDEELIFDVAEALVNAGYRKQSEPFSCNHENGGEWVQLPCKVGDTLYVISQTKDKRILPFISTYEATSISVGKRKCIVYHEMDGYIKLFKQDDFGKTVFLTKEEAEQAVTDIRVGRK